MGREVVHFGLDTRGCQLFSGHGVAFHGILVGKAQRAGQLIQAVIGLGRHDVVLYLYHFAQSCPHQGSGMVAVAEGRTNGVCPFLHPLRSNHRLRVHGYECGNAVAAVNVECLGHGAEAVGGIDIATMAHVVVQTPAQLIAFACLPIMVPEGVEAMQISSLGTDDISEDAVLGHVQRGQFEEIVAAVFQDDAMAARLFAQVHQIPALLQVQGRRHLDGHVLAMFQSIACHGIVVQPVGGDIYQVDVIAFAQLFIAFCARIDFRTGHTCTLQIALTSFCPHSLIVAQCHDLRAGDMRKAFHRTRATHAQAHKADAHHLQTRCGQTKG